MQDKINSLSLEPAKIERIPGRVLRKNAGDLKSVLKYCTLAIIALLIINLSIGCKKDQASQPPPVEQKNLIPFMVGNSWEYKLTCYDSTGTSRFVTTDTETISVDSLYMGNHWFRYLNNEQYYRNSDTGVLICNLLQNGPPELEYKYPCSQNEVYGNWKIVSINQPVSVPAGSFNCICYMYSKTSGRWTDKLLYYIEPGGGLVKKIQYGNTPAYTLFVQYVWELNSRILVK